MDTDRIEAASSHRPWPLPERRWLLFQRWRNLLFAHWPAAPGRLREVVPDALSLDVHDGAAWLTIAPFRIEGLRPRWPPIPGVSGFPELNLRTYVRFDGRPGVYFFSLDTSSTLSVIGARLFFGLPYRRARMRLTEAAAGVEVRSRRRGGRATFRASYRPAGRPFEAEPGTLAHFLTERYTLFAPRGGAVLETEIHHLPWRLRRAEAEIVENRLPEAAGVPCPDGPPLLHFAERQDTLVWAPRRHRV